jgi:hypothetical protein
MATQCRILNTGQAGSYRKRSINRWFMIDACELTNGDWAVPEAVTIELDNMRVRESLSQEERDQAEGAYNGLHNKPLRDVLDTEFVSYTEEEI